YRKAGRYDEAIVLHERVRDVRAKNLGADHPQTILALANLGQSFRSAGRLQDAVRSYEQAAAAIEKAQFQHEFAESILFDTIRCCEQAGRWDQAEIWRRQWLAVVKQQSGAESPAYTGELAALGANLIRQQKFSDAELVLRECIATRDKFAPDDWRTAS